MRELRNNTRGGEIRVESSGTGTSRAPTESVLTEIIDDNSRQFLQFPPVRSTQWLVGSTLFLISSFHQQCDSLYPARFWPAKRTLVLSFLPSTTAVIIPTMGKNIPATLWLTDVCRPVLTLVPYFRLRVSHTPEQEGF